MAEATAFFDSRNNFDSDINDIIIEVAANALHINLYLCEESNKGNICILCHRGAEPSFLDYMVKHTKGQIIHCDSIVFEQVASQQSTSDGLQNISDGPPIPADVGTPTHEPEMSTLTHEAENEEQMTEYEYQCLLEKDFSFHLFNSVTSKNVDQLPPYNNGKKIYKMKSGPHTWENSAV